VRIKIPIRGRLLLALLACTASLSFAIQQPDPAQPTLSPHSAFSLEELSQRAGIIFAGTVVKIEMPAESSDESTRLVRITFRVDDGILNANSGEMVTINEWAGLWRPSAGQRYRQGEKLLMFYYRPSASGATSPVGGSAGRFAISAQDQIHLTSEHRQLLFRSARLRAFEQELNTDPGNKQSPIAYGTVGRALRLIVTQ
jgi:hypothetical protein